MTVLYRFKKVEEDKHGKNKNGNSFSRDGWR